MPERLFSERSQACVVGTCPSWSDCPQELCPCPAGSLPQGTVLQEHSALVWVLHGGICSVSKPAQCGDVSLQPSAYKNAPDMPTARSSVSKHRTEFPCAWPSLNSPSILGRSNKIFLGSCPPRTWMPSFWREPTQTTQQCGSSLSHQWPRLWLWLGSETKDTGNEAALFARTLQKKCLSWLCYWGTCSLPQIRQYSLVCIFAEKVVWQALSHWTFSVRLVTLSPVTMTETLHMVHNFCLWVCNTNIGPIILRCHCCRYN